jgi:hypothetical protein
MARKRKGRKRKDLNRVRAKDCCGCSIISWEKKKFDKLNELFFSDTHTLRETDYEQHWLVPPVCNGRVECNRCGNVLCHDCVCAFHKAIKSDHPDLDDSWLQATMDSSPEHVLQIPVGHCCIMKEKEVKKQPMTLLFRSNAHPLSRSFNDRRC